MNNTKLQDGTMTSTGWVRIGKFLAEYNPKRYDLYASLFSTNLSKDEILNMYLSPMYEFVFQYRLYKITGKKFDSVDTRYYKMQRLYGRTHSFAVAKTSNFIKMFEHIGKYGLKTHPLVLPVGNGMLFSIKDGHHRISCCMALEHKKIICKIIQGQI